MLTGQEAPDSGAIELGDTVQLAYVDQSRDDLSAGDTVWEAISGGAEVIELHTGAYCDHFAEGNMDQVEVELKALRDMSAYAHSLGLEVHAGHGLTYETVKPIAALPEVKELNIGHFLMGESIFRGLKPAIYEMRRLMDDARA